MNHHPDKFFREKLNAYQKPVSADVWQRISQNVQKKHRWILRLRIAAAVLLLAASTLLIYPVATDEPARVAENHKTEKNDMVIRPEARQDLPRHTESLSPRSAIATPEEKRRSDIGKSKRDSPVAPAGKSKKATDLKPQEIFTLPPAEALESNPLAIRAADTNNIPKQKIEPHRHAPQHITIVFTSAEVDEKYLAKNTDAKATRGDKQTSGLRKLLDKAYDLKHNQDPLGELRQKKNEILAMNFRNEKRTQTD